VENTESNASIALRSALNKYSRFVVEFRKRVFLTTGVFVAGTVLGFIFVQSIIKFLIDILSLKGINIVFTSPFQFINLSITCGATTGLIIAFPLIIVQLLMFLKPALKPREYKLVVGFLPFCLGLFLIGFAFGALIMKWQIEIFLSQSVSLGIGNVLDISRLLSVVMITSALMGVAFQTPIILLILLRLGIIKREKLGKIRPWVYVGSFLFAILLPPDSILADVLLSLPLVILFEFTLILNRIIDRRKPEPIALERIN